MGGMRGDQSMPLHPPCEPNGASGAGGTRSGGSADVEVVYDTSSKTTTRVAQGGSLSGGTKALNAQAR
jgi:hypothetical protein